MLEQPISNRASMSLGSFFSKQLIDVIQWTEEEAGILAARYPMLDMEIQNGAQLTVRESQMAVFVNEGRIADLFAPGRYTLTTQNLPLLTDLLNWDKGFESPFKSDVYFFSTRMQTGQKWGTATPVTIREKEFGAVRLRGYGIYSWHVADPRIFHTKVSGTREVYHVSNIEGQLRNTIVSHMSDAFANSDLSFLDMAANQLEMGRRIAETVKPRFAELGLALDTFVVESLSLPEELQKPLDARIGMSMVGDLARYTQYEAASSIPIAAANEGSPVALGAGLAMGSQMIKMMTAVPPSDAAAKTKFCIACGKAIPKAAKYCSHCGGGQE